MINKIIPYPGFKGSFAKSITKHFPKHKIYVEPFVGALGIILNKKQSNIEIINDLNGELINLYQVIKYNKDDLKTFFNLSLNSRAHFKLLKRQEDLSNVMKAYRTMYLRYNSLNGNAHSFISHDKNYISFDKIIDRIEKTHERLRNVNIENRDYSKIIEMNNKKDTLHYLDPPYFETDNTGYSHKAMNLEKFLEVLKSIKGNFILSHTRFEAFDKEFESLVIGNRLTNNYKTSANKNAKPRAIEEVIYSNFKLNKEKPLF